MACYFLPPGDPRLSGLLEVFWEVPGVFCGVGGRVRDGSISSTCSRWYLLPAGREREGEGSEKGMKRE